jgi:hypothetical protein
MNVAIGIQEDVIGLDISVDNVLLVNIPQRTAQFGNPEPNSLFSEGLSGDVESQITAAHQIDYEIPIAAC